MQELVRYVMKKVLPNEFMLMRTRFAAAIGNTGVPAWSRSSDRPRIVQTAGEFML
jgi:hypothetical protein